MYPLEVCPWYNAHKFQSDSPGGEVIVTMDASSSGSEMDKSPTFSEKSMYRRFQNRPEVIMRIKLLWPFLTLQPDFMPFTTYIAFPEPTWVSILQRFTLRGYFQILSGDVPWTLDADGTALLNLTVSPRSALLFLLLNLFYHHQRGRDFAHGIAHFVVLGFQMRLKSTPRC